MRSCVENSGSGPKEDGLQRVIKMQKKDAEELLKNVENIGRSHVAGVPGGVENPVEIGAGAFDEAPLSQARGFSQLCSRSLGEEVE